ncbi:MAG: MFS transporter, partial [Burkholderiales bacterium]
MSPHYAEDAHALTRAAGGFWHHRPRHWKPPPENNSNCHIVRATTRGSALAPFRVRGFRFQWPADLATSWAFEMETLILGWYVLVETRSVLLLTVFASLQHMGTLLAPMFGVMADRLGHRNVLCAMRAVYATLATTMMIFAFTGTLTPVHVFAIASLTGLVRPSDIGMRAALVGNTMPPAQLMGAMSIQRTTQDSAKIAGALTGAGLVALLGMAPAYLVVAALYATSVFLTLKAGPAGRPAHAVSSHTSPWRDLKEGAAYVWATPHLRAVMCLAFMLNLTAFPLFNGLQPYVAKEIFFTDQRGLGYLIAGGASGALVSALVLSRHGTAFRPARMMLAGCVLWYAFLLLYAHVPDHATGIVVLFLAGSAHSVSQVPMVALLLRTMSEQFRGRVMGIRMMMIYGNVPGLIIAGQLIGHIGYALTATIYCLLGITV